MLKFIHLKLLKIKYQGDSIGRDIRVEIEMLGKSLRIDKRIRAGTVVEINQTVGRFEADGGLFEAEVLMTVIEKDFLFNDVGSSKGYIKVNTAITKPQQFTFEVQVRERRSISGKSQGKTSAIFEITLEAEVSDSIKYVPDLDESQGFLKIWLEDSKSIEQLPAYLEVKPERTDAKREYFTILEGPYRGRPASVKRRDDGASWFMGGFKHDPMVRAKYSISQKIFFLQNKKYNTSDYPSAPWKKGLYDIEIPDYAHEKGRKYLNQSKRAMTWFKIGHSGERYLHAGGYSLGCITVTEVTRWMEIYKALIKTRKGDFISVGILEVVD